VQVLWSSTGLPCKVQSSSTKPKGSVFPPVTEDLWYLATFHLMEPYYGNPAAPDRGAIGRRYFSMGANGVRLTGKVDILTLTEPPGTFRTPVTVSFKAQALSSVMELRVFNEDGGDQGTVRGKALPVRVPCKYWLHV
jgi:hypothetical protein